MSEMVPDARVASESSPDVQVAQILWLDRWTDIKPSAPPLIARGVDISQATSPPTAEPMTRSLTVILLFALLVIALPLAIIALPQGIIYRRQSE
jgi:hypothetical protein